jgi:hypothetical protein
MPRHFALMGVIGVYGLRFKGSFEGRIPFPSGLTFDM